MKSIAARLQCGGVTFIHRWDRNSHSLFESARPGNTLNGCTVSVDRSRDGQNYAFAGQVRFCAASAAVTTPPTLMCSPDQEHVAADPVRLRPRGVGPGIAVPKDQVYVAWRQFTAVATASVNTCAKLGTGNEIASIVAPESR